MLTVPELRFRNDVAHRPRVGFDDAGTRNGIEFGSDRGKWSDFT